jgi:mono/diheme cytochrome c family protein
MTATSQKNKGLRWILLAIVLSLIVMAIGLAVFHRKDWNVPAANKNLKNPLLPTESNLAAAREIYENKCSDCHGEKGKGDGSEAMMYDPLPSDLTDAARMNKVTDGEIFFQISEGRKPMPSYKKKLTEEQRWQLVLLVRSFANAAASARTAVPENGKPEPGRKAD